MGYRRRKTARNVKLRGGVRPDIKDIMDRFPASVASGKEPDQPQQGAVNETYRKR